jgi:hypothetical protein
MYRMHKGLRKSILASALRQFPASDCNRILLMSPGDMGMSRMACWGLRTPCGMGI